MPQRRLKLVTSQDSLASLEPDHTAVTGIDEAYMIETAMITGRPDLAVQANRVSRSLRRALLTNRRFFDCDTLEELITPPVSGEDELPPIKTMVSQFGPKSMEVVRIAVERKRAELAEKEKNDDK